MWIFYKHLPFGTTTRKINNVTLKGFNSKLGLAYLFKRNIIRRSKIIRIKDLKADSIEYHAIVQVDSPITARNIIENLDGKTINGLYLNLHRYHRRYPARDRRNHQTNVANLRERRKGDRRRNNLIMKVLEIS
jgi:tRNA U54 and U55 pseudouridine synthase Pus10